METASWNDLMTWELQPTLEASVIELPAMGNHIPCMACIAEVTLGAFMSSLGVNGPTKYWEAYKHDPQFGENEYTVIAKSQGPRKEDNARINKVSAKRPGFGKLIEKLRIGRHFEKHETDYRIAENAWCIDYSDTWSSKWVHLLPNTHSTHHTTIDYEDENIVEFENGVTWASLTVTRIHPCVLKIPIFSYYQPLFIIQDTWTIVKYVMEVLTLFWDWTLWMLTRHTVTLHHIITVYNDIFDHMAATMWALA